MVDVIPPRVKRIWDDWNIRGVLLFSLSLQTLLIILAPLRKATGKTFFVFIIWISYLLADWAATFGVGLMATTQGKGLQQTIPENTNLLAFWAPFLILHLGGPDSVTALALEDNELWLRHLLGLISQVGAALYIFALSLPNNKIWFPTVLMFIAGVIKYAERTRALFVSSFKEFRDSLLSEPDPGLNYAKLMDDYTEKIEANVPMHIIYIPEPVEENETGNEIHHLSDVQVVRKAYVYFKTFKGLVVGLIFSFRVRKESRDFFRHLEAETALRLLEVELNFIYDILYTKVQVIRSVAGYILRALAFGVVLASLGLFYFKIAKNEFKRFDVRVTYTLLLGAIALDFISLFMLIFSDWTLVALLRDQDDEEEEEMANVSPAVKLKRQLASALTVFIKCKRPIWYPSKCREHGQVRHHVLATPILFRRWSGSVSRYNLIGFCLKGSPQRIHEVTSWSCVVTKWILKWSGAELLYHSLYSFYTKTLKDGINRVHKTIVGAIYAFLGDYMITRVRCFHRKLVGFSGLYNAMRFVSIDRLTRELWTFIFHELKHKSDHADDPQAAEKISSARGDWILMDTGTHIPENYKTEFIRYVTDDIEYDESLLLWHIATELCYHEGDDTLEQKSNQGSQPNVVGDTAKIPELDAYDYREFSKMLSDYMIYLLVMQSTLIPAVAGIHSKIRYRDTCAEAERFFVRRRLGPKDQQEACKQILEVNTDVEPSHLKGNMSKSVVFDACILAKKLIAMEKETQVSKWDFLSKMWVELLSYAAVHCNARTQFQQLSSGGELITFVWLLMVHFGFSNYYKINEGQARAKLVVGKQIRDVVQVQSSRGEPAPDQNPQNLPGVGSSADTQTLDSITQEIS